MFAVIVNSSHDIESSHARAPWSEWHYYFHTYQDVYLSQERSSAQKQWRLCWLDVLTTKDPESSQMTSRMGMHKRWGGKAYHHAPMRVTESSVVGPFNVRDSTGSSVQRVPMQNLWKNLQVNSPIPVGSQHLKYSMVEVRIWAIKKT